MIRIALILLISIFLFGCSWSEFNPPEIPKIWDAGYPRDWFNYPGVFHGDFSNSFEIVKWKQRWFYVLKTNLNNFEWVVYLRAYSVPNNIELSKNKLLKLSEHKVKDSNDIIQREFKIYEWDWWEFYWVRFELWLKWENNFVSQKIWEKYYIIEWWQR